MTANAWSSMLSQPLTDTLLWESSWHEVLLWKSCFESIIPQTKPNQTALSKWVKCSDAMLSNVTTLRLATRTPVVSNVVALQESWYYLYQTWSFVISFRVTFTWPSKPLLRTWPATGYEQTRLKNGAAAGRSPPSTCCVQFSLLMFHCMNVLFLWNTESINSMGNRPHIFNCRV